MRLVAVIRAHFGATTRRWDLWCTRPLESTYVVGAPVAPLFYKRQLYVGDSKSSFDSHIGKRPCTAQQKAVRFF